MDTNRLRALVGEQHEEEAKALLDENEGLLEKVRFRNPKIVLVLSILLGIVALDRLYQSGVKVFLGKLAMLLLTLGTWWLVDIGYSVKMTQEVNYNKIVAAAQGAAATIFFSHIRFTVRPAVPSLR